MTETAIIDVIISGSTFGVTIGLLIAFFGNKK